MTIHHRWPNHASTTDLVASFAEGDECALGILMTRFSGLMHHAARKHVRNDADAADAVQEAWATFASRAATVREPERLAGWLRVTTTRAALGIALRQARLEPVADVDLVRRARLDADGGEPDPAGARRTALAVALGGLAPRERQLVLLLVAEPRRSYAEIARIMGCSIGSIGPTRQRVCSKLARDPALVSLALDGAA